MGLVKIHKVDVRIYWDVWDKDYPQFYQTLKFDIFPAAEYKKKRWLFLDTLEREEKEDAIPEKIIFHSDWEFREIPRDKGYLPVFDYQLLTIVPLSVFYHTANMIRPEWGYEIIEYPEISLPCGFSFP